ncbi:hypothetical protein OsccyDRAFT_0549 [Leptolyngbyaceae cyanobacterium JSC-12]|nr:hypothetical protein OsccyDRAFT_0549 [Leptolyngbyaceae cyanobacterium JSC-12]
MTSTAVKGVLVTPEAISQEFATLLMGKLDNQPHHAVALSVTRGWETEDKQIYEQCAQSLLTKYQEVCKPPALKRDMGYVLGCSTNQQSEHANPFSAFCERVNHSQLSVACLISLNKSEAVIKFERFKLSADLKPRHALMFPANWMYQPTLLLPEASTLYTVTTFFTWQ